MTGVCENARPRRDGCARLCRLARKRLAENDADVDSWLLRADTRPGKASG